MPVRYILFFVLLAVIVKPCYGSDNYVRYYTIDNGLTQNEVTKIIQDSKGFLWFATRGGLNKFDGYNFTHFTSNINHKSIPLNPSIECLYEDRKGNIWIGTKSGGLDLYDPKLATSRNFNATDSSKIRLSGNHIISILEDAEGELWFGTWTKGVTVYDPKNDTVQYLLPNTRVSVITEYDKNNIWFGTNQGIFVYNKNERKMTHLQLGLPDFDITNLIIDHKNQVVWYTGWGKCLLKYSLKNQNSTQYNIDVRPLPSTVAAQIFNGFSLMLDSKGFIWLGSWGKGLYGFDPVTEKFKKIEIKPNGSGTKNIDYDIILDIFEDREGSVWIGTDGGGACQIENNPFFNGISLTNDRGNGLNNYHILSVLKDRSGTLWLGTRNGLFYSKNRQDFFEVNQISDRNSPQKTSPILDRMQLIKTIFEDDQQNLWIGADLGLYKIFKNGNQYFFENGFNKTEQALLKVSCIYAENNRLFVGTQQSGLWVMNDYTKANPKWQNFVPEASIGLKNERISLIKGDNRHRIWLGTYSGLSFYDVDSNKIVPVKFSDGFYLSGDIILSWCQYDETTYFIGTPFGLNQLNEQPNGEFTVKKYFKEDGLPNEYIDALTMDQSGNLWISTNYGISSFNVKANTWRNYVESDGLQGQSFSEDCVFNDHGGEIIFGGIRGFNYFHPSDIAENKVVPQINLTSFRIHNKLVLPGQKLSHNILINQDISDASSITLDYTENEFSISFASTSYKTPERNRFQYRLVNSDDQWIDGSRNPTVYYNNLKPGDYIFEVRGSNNHNTWSVVPATIKITLLPPPWKSKWALLIYLIFVLTLVWLIRWVAVRQAILRHNLQMEKLKNEQENRVSEIKFQFFTNISHEFRTPLTLIFAPLNELIKKAQIYNLQNEALEKIKMIYNNTNRLMILVNQLLDFRKAETNNLKLLARYLDIEEFISEVCYPFYELSKIQDIRLQFESSLKHKKIWFDQNKMEIILNNLISNALKFNKQGGFVYVSIEEDENEVIVKVKNSGKGISATSVPHIFERFYQGDNNENIGGTGIGLALVKELIELHQGGIEVESEPDKLTEFRIKLKKGELHLKPGQKITDDFQSDQIAKEMTQRGWILPSRKKNLVSGECILIIEDNAEINHYLASLLEPLYRVETALNGKEGFKKAIELIPDLIISDIMMPEMDGFELCNKIKLNDLTTNVPVILLTAKSSDQHKLMGIQTGADDYISKPFDPNYLVEKVQNLLLTQKKLKKQFSKSIRLEPANIEIEPSDEIFLKKCISIIEKNLQTPEFSAFSLAIELNLSNSSLYRKLKALSNLSPVEFIRSIRIKRAAQLLQDKNKTVSEAAFESGFNDLKYFRQVFHNEFSCAPSEYRLKMYNGSDLI